LHRSSRRFVGNPSAALLRFVTFALEQPELLFFDWKSVDTSMSLHFLPTASFLYPHFLSFFLLLLSSSAIINMARPLKGRYFDGGAKVCVPHHLHRSISLPLVRSLVCRLQLWRSLPTHVCGWSTAVSSPSLNVLTPGSSSCNATTKVSCGITHLILRFASMLVTLSPKVFDEVQGYGRPYLSNLINRPGSAAALSRKIAILDVANSDGLATQEFVSVALQLSADATAAQPLSVSLAWTDYQGSVLSQKALVNDLDLIVSVQKPGAGSVTVFRGGGGRLPDTRNNAEKVMVSALAAAGDTVIVNVSAWSVPSGRQGFALVVVGYFHPASFTVSNPSNSPLALQWNPDHTFLRLYLSVAYAMLTNDEAALQQLQSSIKSSVATLIRCDAACVRLSSIVRDTRFRSSTGCSVDISFKPCAVDTRSSPERPFLLLLSGYKDPQSMFYQLDGLSSATGLMTPDEAVAVRTIDDSSQNSTNLTIAVIALAVVVVLLVTGGSVYCILSRLKTKAKVSPATDEPKLQMNDAVAQEQPDESELPLLAAANVHKHARKPEPPTLCMFIVYPTQMYLRSLMLASPLPFTDEHSIEQQPPPFTMEMWADEAAIASEAASLEQALNSQISKALSPLPSPLFCHV
jgi:hypothetical protein